jgi:hypothetical protein
MTYSVGGTTSTECSVCPSGLASGSGATECVVGSYKQIITLTSNGTSDLQPGLYKFEIAGAGGGAGAGSCDNCGGTGFSQAGGNGELKTVEGITLTDKTTISYTIGTAGAGGAGAAADNKLFDQTPAKCHFVCQTTGTKAKCNDGAAGGGTSLTLKGATHTAAGGPGGKGKEWLGTKTGPGETWYTQYTQENAGNGQGSAGGFKIMGQGANVKITGPGYEAWNTQNAQGYNGTAGQIRIFKIDI